MFRLPVLTVIALAGAMPAQDGALSVSAFRDRFSAALQQATGMPISVIDDWTFRTKQRDGTEITVNVDNAYGQYLADPNNLDQVISRFVGTLAAPSAGDVSLDQLVVIVRPSDYLVRSLPSGASLEHFVPSHPMAGDMAFFLAIDAPETIRTVTKDDLKRWRIDEAAAWRRAVVNLKARVGPLSMVHLGDETGAIGIGAASGLAPSILADPALCGPDAPSGSRHQIVLVYSRDAFLFALPADKRMTATFWRSVTDEVRAGRSMSETPLTCIDGKWTTMPRP